MRRMVLCLLLLAPAGLASAETSFQFAAPGHQSPRDSHVNGFRFSVLHGNTQSVRGLDLGLLAVSESAELSGARFVLGMSRVTGAMTGGAAFSLINVHTGRDKGVNGAFINKLNDAPEAVDIGFVNIADASTNLDIGGLNVSKKSNVQLGFINVTDQISGFQFGFVNIAKNGFMPFFPIFNFPKN